MTWSHVLPLLTVMCVPLIAVMSGAGAVIAFAIKQFKASVDARFDDQTAAINMRFDDQTAALNAKLSDQTTALNLRFDDQNAAINARFDGVDKRIDGIDRAMVELRTDLRALSHRVDTLAGAGAGI